MKKMKTHSLGEMITEYRWLRRYSYRYKAQVVWYIWVGVLGTAMSLAASVLSKHIIDAVTGFNSRGIIAAVVFFVLMQLSRIGVSAITSRIGAKISIQVNQEITAQVYDKLLRSDWQSLSAYHSGDLLSRVVGDVSTVSSSVLGWFPDLCTRLLQFFGTLGVILYYDSTLALLALISAPVTLLMSRYVVTMMRHHNQQMRALSSETVIFNEESFQNILLIKSFDRTDAYSQKHRALQQRYKDATLDYNRFTIYKNSIMSLVGTVVAMVCFLWSIYRLYQGHITYGTVTLFLQLSASLATAFSALTGLIPGFISTATAAGRIMALMDLPLEDQGDTPKTDSFIKSHGGEALAVVGQNITCRYENEKPVLSHANFRVDAGQIVAFVGPSGEGKTTLLRLLLGIVSPEEGNLMLQAENGESIEISPASRKLFAYVPQNNALFSGTIAENLRLIKPEATEKEIEDALTPACADEFVRKLPLGLNTPVKEKGGLSEGQIQRLCIARALLSDAPILLLDEATSALDRETEKTVLRNVLLSKKHRTCIVTTHRPGVLEISHRIYSISHDQIQPFEQ